MVAAIGVIIGTFLIQCRWLFCFVTFGGLTTISTFGIHHHFRWLGITSSSSDFFTDYCFALSSDHYFPLVSPASLLSELFSLVILDVRPLWQLSFPREIIAPISKYAWYSILILHFSSFHLLLPSPLFVVLSFNVAFYFSTMLHMSICCIPLKMWKNASCQSKITTQPLRLPDTPHNHANF